MYLGAALRPRPDLSKTTGYSLFLRAIEPFGSLTLVAGLQHLMGLGAAVMIYLLLRRAGAPPQWATAATLPVLFDGFEIEDEHMIMAEALFTFLVMLALLLLLWRARVPWPVALLAGLDYYYFHLKPQTMPTSRSWIPGGTAYSDAAQYGHATPSRVVEPFATLIAGYERVFYTYGPLFGLILVMGLGGVVRMQRRPIRLIWLARSRRAGSMLPWVTAIVLLVFPIAIADFDYRYLVPVLPFACLAAGLAFAPGRDAVTPDVPAAQDGGDRIARVVHGRRFGQLLRSGGVRRILSAGESAGRSRRAQAR